MRILDISGTQIKPGIDWPAVLLDQLRPDGVIVKSTEGATYTSRYCEAGVRGAYAVGLPVGTYHYGRPDLGSPDPVVDARAEAEHYVAHRQSLGVSLRMPYALDLEEGRDELGDEHLTRWVCAWGDRVAELAGDDASGMLLYVSPSYLRHLDPTYAGLRRYRLWVAHYGVHRPTIPHGTGDRPHCWTDYALHQYTSDGRVAGISTRVDLSRGSGMRL